MSRSIAPGESSDSARASYLRLRADWLLPGSLRRRCLLKALHRREEYCGSGFGLSRQTRRFYSLNNNILKTIPVSIFVSVGFFNKLWREVLVILSYFRAYHGLAIWS